MPWINTRDNQVVSDALLTLIEGHNKQASAKHKAYYKSLLFTACRELEKFITPTASLGAQALASELGIGDIRKYKWNEQAKKMKDPQRKKFQWEHVYPVSLLTKRLLELSPATKEAISLEVAKTDIAWILKSENDRLNKGSFKSDRPNNPIDAYSISGIKTLD